MLSYGYISNGFGDHTLEQMAEVLARHGYRGIGITLDPRHLDPFAAAAARLAAVRDLCQRHGLTPAIETGARYVLDPFRKHSPTLIDATAAGRARRADYYHRAIEIASAVGARVVSIWSGAADPPAVTPDDAEECWERLQSELPPILDAAAAHDVTVAFEPEPGMFVADLAGWAELRRRVDHPALALTVDLGHLAITEPPPLADSLHTWRDDLAHVHIDDVRNRRHEHLPLGEGEIDFAPLIGALRDIDFQGLALVELSRHSHVAPLQASRSIEFLRDL